MMTLKAKYEKKEDIPEAYVNLFVMREDNWVLTNIEGIKTDDDVNKIKQDLNTEKKLHKETKEKLNKFNDLNPDEVYKKLDAFEELQAQVDAGQGGKIDEEKLDVIVTQRVNREKAPLERDLAKQLKQVEELSLVNTNLSDRITQTKIEATICKAAGEADATPTAVEDIVMYAQRIFEVADNDSVLTKDNVGTTPGILPSDWLIEMKQSKPHWFLLSKGGGSTGGTGDNFSVNPWTKDNWNLTNQGTVVKEQGIDKAHVMAKAANSKVGAVRPTVN